jgi:hypothetical protein
MRSRISSASAVRRASEAAWNVPQLAVEVLVWREGGHSACDWQAIKAAEEKRQSDLLRDSLNPFRPGSVEPSGLTPTARELARAAYEERLPPSGELDSARLAVLADGLEEAGCTDRAILDHLRGPGSHVRGCWAVDLCLEKQGALGPDVISPACGTVYVALLDEGTDAWRPVAAEQVRPGLFRLLGPVPEGEHWQFQPGDIVRCQERVPSAGRALTAVERSDNE